MAPAIIIVVCLFALLCAGGAAYGKLNQLFRTFTGRALTQQDVKRVVQERQVQEASTPRSVSSMTSLCLPRIQADFPDFNWEQMRAQAITVLQDALLASASGDLSHIGAQHGELRAQLLQRIQSDKQSGAVRHVSDVSVHGVEIVRYLKQRGTCTIKLQAAAGARMWAEENGAVVEGDRAWDTQAKYSIDLISVQDAQAVPGTGLAFNCPNCGAPVAQLGERKCVYCGSAIEAVNIKLWAFGRIKRLG